MLRRGKRGGASARRSVVRLLTPPPPAGDDTPQIAPTTAGSEEEAPAGVCASSRTNDCPGWPFLRSRDGCYSGRKKLLTRFHYSAGWPRENLVSSPACPSGCALGRPSRGASQSVRRFSCRAPVSGASLDGTKDSSRLASIDVSSTARPPVFLSQVPMRAGEVTRYSGCHRR
ncbi:hypothetical protein MRX96_025252 [Rhipicephalus microplus]